MARLLAFCNEAELQHRHRPHQQCIASIACCIQPELSLFTQQPRTHWLPIHMLASPGLTSEAAWWLPSAARASALRRHALERRSVNLSLSPKAAAAATAAAAAGRRGRCVAVEQQEQGV
jgi:hypothetical protein